MRVSGGRRGASRSGVLAPGRRRWCLTPGLWTGRWRSASGGNSAISSFRSFASARNAPARWRRRGGPRKPGPPTRRCCSARRSSIWRSFAVHVSPLLEAALSEDPEQIEAALTAYGDAWVIYWTTSRPSPSRTSENPPPSSRSGCVRSSLLQSPDVLHRGRGVRRPPHSPPPPSKSSSPPWRRTASTRSSSPPAAHTPIRMSWSSGSSSVRGAVRSTRASTIQSPCPAGSRIR